MKNKFNSDYNHWEDDGEHSSPFIPVEVQSRIMANWFYGLDSQIVNLESKLNHYKKEEEKYRELYYKEVNRAHQASFANMANTLLACIGTPKASSLGTVGATMLARIRNMQTIEEVHKYINETFEIMKNEDKETE